MSEFSCIQQKGDCIMSIFSKKIKNLFYNSDFDIDFFEELSTGALVFKIIDCDNNFAGHVIAHDSDIKILESSFYNFTTADRDYLEQRAREFWNALD